MAQLWLFETPVSVLAETPVNLTWSPKTFNSVNYGNFALNLWLLRADNKTDKLVKSYPSVLLARNVYKNFVLWTPTLDDVDSNEVAQYGWTQLSWEETKDNPSADPYNTSFQGFSQGFHVMLPLSSSTSSSSPSATSSISPATSTSSPTSTSLPNGTAGSVPSTTTAVPAKSNSSMTGLGIGLGIALGLLFLIGLAAAIWGVRKYRRKKKENGIELPHQDNWQAKDMYTPTTPYGAYKPVGLPPPPPPPPQPREMEVYREAPNAVEMMGTTRWSGVQK
ncbi:hypothetical protein CJF32_00009640 [Rutstroemia sp. NJR-2017a WRK4]|nr:hypothetical protein CJF32_00009640 [Rutstroemia sp. NJR-2017a WRK4]